MELNPREQARLARLLAGRLPGFAERSRAAEAAGVAGSAQLSGPPDQVWRDVVDRACAADTLPALLRSAAALSPGDRRLEKAAASAAAGDRIALGPPPAALIAGLLAAALIAGGGALWLRPASASALASGDSAGAAPAAAPEGSAAAEEATPAEVPAADRAADDAAGAAEDSPAPGERGADREAEALAAMAPAPAAEGGGGAEVDAAVDAAGAAGPGAEDAALLASADPCAAPEGRLLGYWYTAGAPPAVGATFTITSGVNVRADYPRLENSWDIGARVVCVLSPGDRVVVHAPPIDAGGGHWWIPLNGGGLIRR
jgi:hypothetical protein